VPPMTIRVGVLGAGGRMGATVCDAVAADDELDLVAAVDPFTVGRTVQGIEITDDLERMLADGVDVVVDFTTAEAARRNLPLLAAAGVHAVVGTTGFDAADLDRFEADFRTSGVLVAANFAIGAVLMMRFAELAAPFFETVEVIELHHDQKLDAPSGTAMTTVERIAAASDRWGEDPTRSELLPGARGGVGPAGVHVHSVRLRGLVAHQEVLFGAAGQLLTVRHDSFDRVSFMPGVVLAAKRIVTTTGLTRGLEPLLGI